MKGFDPLENAKRGASTPSAAPLPPPFVPSTGGNGHATSAGMEVAAEVLEKERHKLEGTPVHYPPEPARQVQVMPQSSSKPPTVKRYRVLEAKVVNVRGGLTKLAKGSIVTESSHDFELLRAHKVKLEPVDS